MRRLTAWALAWLLVSVLCAFQTEKQSELARLMRRMIDEATSKRQQALKGSALGNYPKWMSGLYTARPTDPAVHTDEFQELAQGFMQASNYAYAKHQAAADVTRGYNLMIASCVECHIKYCPGPLPRIRALQVQ